MGESGRRRELPPGAEERDSAFGILLSAHLLSGCNAGRAEASFAPLASRCRRKPGEPIVRAADRAWQIALLNSGTHAQEGRLRSPWKKRHVKAGIPSAARSQPILRRKQPSLQLLQCLRAETSSFASGGRSAIDRSGKTKGAETIIRKKVIGLCVEACIANPSGIGIETNPEHRMERTV